MVILLDPNYFMIRKDQIVEYSVFSDELIVGYTKIKNTGKKTVIETMTHFYVVLGEVQFKGEYVMIPKCAVVRKCDSKEKFKWTLDEQSNSNPKVYFSTKLMSEIVPQVKAITVNHHYMEFDVPRAIIEFQNGKAYSFLGLSEIDTSHEFFSVNYKNIVNKVWQNEKLDWK